MLSGVKPEPGPRIPYPQRLHHETPGWVKSGAAFHVRIRASRDAPIALTDPAVAPSLLASVANYHDRGRWHFSLFLLMPDHVHALLAVPADARLSRVVGEWKRFTTRQLHLRWQENFFDHRLRSDADRTETHAYILNNPVAKGLCTCAADWPWIWPVERAVPAR